MIRQWSLASASGERLKSGLGALVSYVDYRPVIRVSCVILNCADIGSFLAHARRFEVRGIVVRQDSGRLCGDHVPIPAQLGST